jgi:metallo-beta-lactamase class B
MQAQLTISGLLSGLLLTGCGTASSADPMTAAYPAELCPSCSEWNEPHGPFQIFGNTYYVGTKGLAAVLITGPHGHVLIDGGLPGSAPLIRENIRALGFDIEDVGLILNTHAHFDHAGGIAALQQAAGARVAASPDSARAIRQGNSGAEDPQYGQLLDFPSVANVEEFADGETIMLGALALTPYRTPAHTPGGTSWSWRTCDADTCLHLVYADSQTPISAQGYRFSDHSNLAGIEDGFAALETLPCDILITPHPGASSFWERHTSPQGLVDSDACLRYAAAARERLARRLAVEQSQQEQARHLPEFPPDPGAEPFRESVE